MQRPVDFAPRVRESLARSHMKNKTTSTFLDHH
jgi:hypothetical protein